MMTWLNEVVFLLHFDLKNELYHASFNIKNILLTFNCVRYFP